MKTQLGPQFYGPIDVYTIGDEAASFEALCSWTVMAVGDR